MTPTPDQLQQQIDELRAKAKTWKLITILLLVGFLLLGWWQCATWRYLDGDAKTYIDSKIPPTDGSGFPKPPPRI